MSLERLKRNQEKLGQVWEEYKSFRDTLPDDDSLWTNEQRSRFDDYDKDIDRIDTKINSIQRSINDDERENRFSQTEGLYNPGFNSSLNRDDDFNFAADKNGSTKRHAFNRYLLEGDRALSPSEIRALTSNDDVGGGYIQGHGKFVKTLLKNLDDEVLMRKYGTVYPIPHNVSLGVPFLDNDADDAEWTAELKTGSDDDNLRFGKRELKPSPSAKRFKVSRKLMKTGALNPEVIVRNRMLYKFGVTEEKAYMVGSGHNKPLGIFVASDDGIPTSRDCATDNTAVLLKADNLIEAQGMLKGPYQKKARWLFHRDAITRLRKLKDGNGQYLWAQGIGAGQPNTILGRPYEISEYCPNTFTANQYVGMLADFSYYWIAVALSVSIQRLIELYAESNLIGYIGRMEVDGMPVLPEAFVRIKMGA